MRTEELDTFTAAMATAEGKVLLHCTIAWRASHLWAAYLIRERKTPVDGAVADADDQPDGRHANGRGSAAARGVSRPRGPGDGTSEAIGADITFLELCTSPLCAYRG